VRSAVTHEAPLRVSVPAARAQRRRGIPWLGSSREKDQAQIRPARARGRSRKTIRIARRIASFEADLMNTIIAALDKKVLVHGDSALRIGIKFNHPTAHAIRIKLLVPRGVKGVREINAFAIATPLPHFGATSQRLVRVFRMRSTIHDSANAH